MSSWEWILNHASIGLPLTVIIVSTMCARIFKFPFWLVISLIGLPLIIFMVIPPESKLLVGYNPLVVLAGGWLGALGILVGVWLGRVIVNFLNPSAPKFSLPFSLGLLGTIGLISALIWAPASVSGGSSSGLVMCLFAVGLLFALLAFSLSAARFLRAGLLLVFWSAVSVVIGSKALLNKLPTEVSSSDLHSTLASVEKAINSTEYRSLVPTELVKRGMTLSALVPAGISQGLADLTVFINGAVVAHNSVKGGEGLTKKIDFPAELSKYPFVKLGLRLAPISDQAEIRATITTPAGSNLIRTSQEG